MESTGRVSLVFFPFSYHSETVRFSNYLSAIFQLLLHSYLIQHLLDRTCLAILQGHTSLVGQLQMRGSTLVTGGSDGSVRVWSLTTYATIHRLAAHDNSVTSLQFDDSRIVSGGSDGRVKIWNLGEGTLSRELSQPAEAVWRVAFESEKCVVMASRGGRTIMEVWDFRPPGEEHDVSEAMDTDDGEVEPETEHHHPQPWAR